MKAELAMGDEGVSAMALTSGVTHMTLEIKIEEAYY
jgi:hypothetical protein